MFLTSIDRTVSEMIGNRMREREMTCSKKGPGPGLQPQAAAVRTRPYWTPALPAELMGNPLIFSFEFLLWSTSWFDLLGHMKIVQVKPSERQESFCLRGYLGSVQTCGIHASLDACCWSRDILRFMCISQWTAWSLWLLSWAQHCIFYYL